MCSPSRLSSPSISRTGGAPGPSLQGRGTREAGRHCIKLRAGAHLGWEGFGSAMSPLPSGSPRASARLSPKSPARVGRPGGRDWKGHLLSSRPSFLPPRVQDGIFPLRRPDLLWWWPARDTDEDRLLPEQNTCIPRAEAAGHRSGLLLLPARNGHQLRAHFHVAAGDLVCIHWPACYGGEDPVSITYVSSLIWCALDRPRAGSTPAK